MKKPDQQTVAFAENLYKNAQKKQKLKTTASLILGSVAGKLWKNGDSLHAMRLNNSLKKVLDSTKSVQEAEKMLDALGNAGIPSNITVAEEFRHSANPRVRASSANVVRNAQTEESEKMLFDMLDDKENVVKMNVINTLEVYSLDGEAISKLTEKIDGGSIDPDQYYYVLGILHKQGRNNKSEIISALKSMKRHSMHTDLSSQASSLLRSLE